MEYHTYQHLPIHLRENCMNIVILPKVHNNGARGKIFWNLKE